MTLSSACEGRPGNGDSPEKKAEALTGPALMEINLSKGAPELGASSLFGPLPGGSHADLLRAIDELDPDDTKGVFVRLGTSNLGFARANELGRVLKKVRDRGIPVVCHADDIDNGTLLFTSRGCGSVWLSPAGGVDSVGIAAQLIYARSALDKLGVGVDFLQVGKYKGAQEPYTRDEPSPEARESLEGTLRDIRKAWVEGISEGRGRPLEVAIEDGPHTAKAALDLGLIDHVGVLDEAREKAKGDVEAGRTEVVFGSRGRESGGGFGEILRAISGGEDDDHVAVVRAVGAITMGPAGGLLGGADGITESGLGRTLTRLTEDDSVKAVVLRIDSPGGSALASDLLWHKLMKLRKKKPLIVSVGGMAASGGYYLSCAANRIYAEPTSIVGSIGVVAGKFALHDTLAKIGVNTVTIAASPDPARAARAAYLSPFDKWDDATRQKVLVSMEGIYETFLDRIVEGRGIDRETISKAAEGRIFGGATAKDRQLIDELGGLDDAIRYALSEAGLGDDGAIRLVGESGGLLELFGGDAEQAEAAAERARSEMVTLNAVYGQVPLEARGWVESLLPMTSGEVTLVASPFAIVLR